MKRFAVIAICTLVLVTSNMQAKDKIRIGVYDSRAIAVGFYQSYEFRETMKNIMGDFKKAKNKGDIVLVKKLEEKGQLMQRIAHDKGFGRGSVAEMIEKKAPDLKGLAEKEKLSIIVSKWEVNFSSADVELVDITLKMLELLKANENVKAMIKDFESNKPIENAFFLED